MAYPGLLTPSESGEFISKNAEHVKIHENGLEKLCQEILKSLNNKLKIPETGATISYLSKEDPRAIDWIFVADALNFCFWSYPGTEKWMVEGHTGYYALEAALIRAIKEGYEITNPKYYSKITSDQLQTVLRSDNSTQIPLFNERLSILHEVGNILIEKYNGTFKTCIEQANKSSVKLLEIIVNNFPCFKDEAVYKNKRVTFYKRAQILVADVWNFFDGKSYGEYVDMAKLTMFADYRVPQVLVYFGVLSYSDELMNDLLNDTLLPSGSNNEIEIRGCSIHAVELIKKILEDKIKYKSVQVPNSCVIDYFLWCYRRKYADKMESIPFHKTLSIFY